MNLTYEDYLKTFHPHEKENVFTHNNWTLSDEVIEIFTSNLFYKQHVRWNIQRFRPSDLTTVEEDDENEKNTQLKKIPNLHDTTKRTTNDNPQQPNTNNDKENEIAHTWSTTLRSKRKAAMNDNIGENQTCNQSRRMKKN